MKKEIIYETKTVIIEVLAEVIDEIGWENFKQHIMDNLIEVNDLIVTTEYEDAYDNIRDEYGVLTFSFCHNLERIYRTYIEIVGAVRDYIRDYIENESYENELKEQVIEALDDLYDKENIELVKSNSLMDILLM